jgi:hypothetical protein
VQRGIIPVQYAGQTEVGNLGCALPCDQYILWLDIPMDDSSITGMFEGGTDLPQKMNAVFGVQRAAPINQIFEGSAFNVFHYKSGRLIDITN